MQNWFVYLSLAALAATEPAASDISLPNVPHSSLETHPNATGHWTASAITRRTFERGIAEGIETSTRSYEEGVTVEVNRSSTVQPTADPSEELRDLFREYLKTITKIKEGYLALAASLDKNASTNESTAEVSQPVNRTLDTVPATNESTPEVSQPVNRTLDTLPVTNESTPEVSQHVNRTLDPSDELRGLYLENIKTLTSLEKLYVRLTDISDTLPVTNESTPEVSQHVNRTLGYTNLPGFGWYKYHTLKANWTAARDTCKKDGADLVTPERVEQMKTIHETFNPKPSHVWFGVYDPYNNNTWITVKGDAVPSFWWSPRNETKDNEYCSSWSYFDYSYGLWSSACNNTFEFICKLS